MTFYGRGKLQTIFLAAMLLAAVATRANAAPVTIDFESYAVDTVLAAGTDLGGVSFDQAIQIWGANQFPPFATGNVALNSDTFAGDFSGVFTQTVSSFSIAVGDNCCDFDSATLYVFDAAHILLGSVGYVNQASGQILSIAVAGIKYFSVDQESAVVFDNLTFDDEAVAPVPEPASIGLFGLGLAGVVAALRKKRSARA